jgi:hypothetical protein
MVYGTAVTVSVEDRVVCIGDDRVATIASE